MSVNETCPESVPVTVVQQPTIELDGSEVLWYDEYFTATSIGYTVARRAARLAHHPISAEAVQVAVDNVLVPRQELGGTLPGFVVRGNVVVLPTTKALTGSSVLFVHYMGYTEAADPNAIPVGMMYQTANDEPPSSWAICDGATEYAITDYRELYAWATENNLVLSSDGTNFILIDLTATVGATTLYMMVYGGNT